MLNKTLLGSAAVIMTMVGAQAADLPSKKAAPATYVKICDAYGAGFFFIPGTDSCIKVGGYVRVDYDYRPERKNTATATTNTGVVGGTKATDQTTTGFYNRGTAQLDVRTPTSMGVARTFMALRVESGAGIQSKASSQASLEGAFVQWAGFTAGQAPQPFAYMSSWAYNTHYWGGFPNGVRQLTYTALLGGGFSTTLGITDMHSSYSSLSSVQGASLNSSAGKDESIHTPGYNGLVYVGNVRYDQSWGSLQVMAAGHNGGDLTGGTAGVNNTVAGGTKKSGYAVGLGGTIKLPMLAAGDELQFTAVYADRLIGLLADSGINTPSAAAYGSNPIGGPAAKFEDGTGWVVGAQLRHYWTAAFRSQFYASYTAREQHTVNSTYGVKGAGDAYTLGKAFIYSPAKDFDIGLEFNYIRGHWNQAAAASVSGYTGTPAGGITESNLVTKLRVQRNF